MRFLPLLQLLATLYLVACGEPSCRPGEIMIGITCYSRSKDGGPDDREPDESDSAEEGRMGVDAQTSRQRDSGSSARAGDLVGDSEAGQIGNADASCAPLPCSSDHSWNTETCSCLTADGSVTLEDTGVSRVDTSTLCVPTAEICDDKDNDCDGAVDEDLGKGDACSKGLGECLMTGVQICSPLGEVVCSATARAKGTEICDGKDNDCNGVLDDNARNECGMPCNAACPPACVPSEEKCDGIDNDCDGVSDDGLANPCGGSCLTSLAHPIGESCHNNKLGLCFRSGTYECRGATTECNAELLSMPQEPAAEVCDGFDNDCDGKVDEEATNAFWWSEVCPDPDGGTSTISTRACYKPTKNPDCTDWVQN